jgi:hypothetical protein
MNKIINHLVNEIVVKSITQNRAFQAFVVRTVDSVKEAGASAVKAASPGSRAGPSQATKAGSEAASSSPRAGPKKIAPEVPENMPKAAAERTPPKPRRVDPRDKGFLSHLLDVVKDDVSGGRR